MHMVAISFTRHKQTCVEKEKNQLYFLQVRKPREHDNPGVDKSLQLWEAGGGKGRNRVRSLSRRKIRLQARPQPNVRVHDQLHPEAQEPAGEVHDEQRAGELHHPSGETICQ